MTSSNGVGGGSDGDFGCETRSDDGVAEGEYCFTASAVYFEIVRIRLNRVGKTRSEVQDEVSAFFATLCSFVGLDPSGMKILSSCWNLTESSTN
ncbi:hypothetical protein TorRG33x02_000100 [Trema orientale]|uniref:Uncharacterized protein n=1 Tax=Trema orientale TaxID=63057 RepID=A0A2P5G0Z9_TREOI|nr:hypothetical protein TorRG33x02_000100 [Trema orientale]